MKALRLPLKRQYFEEIKSGEKKHEYRLYNDYWKKRLMGKDFSHIVLTLGYPKAGDPNRTLNRPWLGFNIKTIQHSEFGEEPVKVFAIRVN